MNGKLFLRLVNVRSCLLSKKFYAPLNIFILLFYSDTVVLFTVMEVIFLFICL